MLNKILEFNDKHNEEVCIALGVPTVALLIADKLTGESYVPIKVALIVYGTIDMVVGISGFIYTVTHQTA
jgi:hypothetical protein